MGFTKSIRTCFRKYFDFSGRASRSEFWWFYLFTKLVYGPLEDLSNAIFGPLVIGGVDNMGFFAGLGWLLDKGEIGVPPNVLQIFIIIPLLAVCARRLHDTGRSGWRQGIVIVAAVLMALSTGSMFNGFFANVIAIVGMGLLITFIVWLASKTEAGPNQYGQESVPPRTLGLA